MVKIPKERCGLGLYALNLHLLYGFVADVKRVGSLKMLEGSSFLRTGVHIRSLYRQSSNKRSFGMEETLQRLTVMLINVRNYKSAERSLNKKYNKELVLNREGYYFAGTRKKHLQDCRSALLMVELLQNI